MEPRLDNLERASNGSLDENTLKNAFKEIKEALIYFRNNIQGDRNDNYKSLNEIKARLSELEEHIIEE